MPSTIQNLLADKPAPLTIPPSTKANEALDLMGRNKYSQLPIVDESKRCSGIVTAESILNSVRLFGLFPENLKAFDCSIKPKEYECDAELFAVSEGLATDAAVMVINNDEDRHLIGILTDYDLAKFFHQRSQNMMLLEEIESALKDFIRFALPPIGETSDSRSEFDLAVSEACTPDHGRDRFESAVSNYISSIKGNFPLNPNALEASYAVLTDTSRTKTSFDKLNFAEYQKMWLSNKRWHKYSNVITMDKNSLDEMLTRVRHIRNDIAHFRGDANEEQTRILLGCRDWMEKYYPALKKSLVQTEEETQSQISEQSEQIEQAAYDTPAQNSNEICSETMDSQNSMRQMPEKSALSRWLNGVPVYVLTTWLPFAKAKSLINNLPSAAFEHRSWWANDPNLYTQSRLWLDAGWETDIVDLEKERVRFRRSFSRADSN